MERRVDKDAFYINRCLELAEMGRGSTLANPMVGAVVVYKGKIIGEGYHQQYGKAHAEVNAINSAKNQELLKKSTIYVNLEPCSHHGKTPPCADLIINKQIPRVVIGAPDTNEKVGGRGIRRLQDAGVDVKVGVLENRCRELNKRFYTFHEKQRPYIILKWAQTQDGFIDKMRSAEEDPHVNWITSKTTRMLVHKWRSEEMAIMAGKNTIIKDNPSLTARDWEGNQPIRIVLDKNLELPSESSVFDKAANTLVFNFIKEGVEGSVKYVKLDERGEVLNFILNYLYKTGISSLFVEGGGTLLQSLIDSGLWDEARIFIGKKVFAEGIKAPRIGKVFAYQQNIGQDRLFVYHK